MSTELYNELLRLIEHQGQVITKLTNENIEQENLINVLMGEKF